MREVMLSTLRNGTWFSYCYNGYEVFRIEDENEDEDEKIRVRRVAFCMDGEWHSVHSSPIEHSHANVLVYPAQMRTIVLNGDTEGLIADIANLLCSTDESFNPDFFVKLDESLEKRGRTFKLDQKGIFGVSISLKPVND